MRSDYNKEPLPSGVRAVIPGVVLDFFRKNFFCNDVLRHSPEQFGVVVSSL